MGERKPACEEADERGVGSERTDHPVACVNQKGAGEKPGRRRTGPEKGLIVPLRLLELTLLHFVPDLNKWLDGLDDPRSEKQSTYPLRHVVWVGLLMFLCGIRSRNQLIGEGNTTGFHANLQTLADGGEDAAAHPGTLNYLMAGLATSELSGLNARIARRMIDMRCFENARLDPDPADIARGRLRSWMVAVDGVQLRTYTKPHCEHCLTRKLNNGKTLYFHSVLEARLVMESGITFHLASVPVINEGGQYDKQDCETKAFPRLAAELKARFPRLRMCILADSLHAVKPFFDVCSDMKWSYIVVFKKGRTPALWKRALKKRDASKLDRRIVESEEGIAKEYSWCVCLEHGGHTVHALFCNEKPVKGKTGRWAWLTSIRPDKSNIEKLTDKGGRLRWKIENEGFNQLKNGGTGLKHDYGSIGNAWYNYYLLAQIVMLLVKLTWHGDIARKLTGDAQKTAKTLFSTITNMLVQFRLSLQIHRLGEVADGINPAQIQIRFDTS
jgi:hypothetical protein